MKDSTVGEKHQAFVLETADCLWNQGDEGPLPHLSPQPEGKSAVSLAEWVTKTLGSVLREKNIDPEGLNTRVYSAASGPSGIRWYVDVNFPVPLAPSVWGFIREVLAEGKFSGTAYGEEISFQFYPLGGAGNTTVSHF